MRRNAAGLRQLLADYDDRDDVRFVFVYQREPHARQMAFDDVPQPATYAERVELARRTLDELRLDADVWVDDLGDTSRAAFGDLPHPAIVVDPAGVVRMKLSWCDPQALTEALPEILAASPDDRPAPADETFPKAIADHTLDRHHRDTMLAHLAVHRTWDPRRHEWLEQLAARGPAQQRTWATALLQPEAGTAAGRPTRRR